MSVTTVELLARRLSEAGVRHAFGVPGGETLPLIEALHQEGVEWVLMKHEGSAGFAADAAATLSGRPGLCIATLGPGATNLITGVAGCLLDRAPVVAVTGQIPIALSHVYTHQTLDQAAMLKPAVKHQVTLTAKEAWREIPLALRHLDLGRPGPVHLNIPMDVAKVTHTHELPAHSGVGPPMPHAYAMGAVEALLREAQRPVVLVGLGALNRFMPEALRAFVEAWGAPTLSTYKAKGLLPEDHPLSLGAFGLSTTADAVHQGFLAGADLLVLVGVDPVELRPQWLPGWSPEMPVVSVDYQPSPDLVHPIEMEMVGNAHGILAELAKGVRRSSWEAAELEAHRARWRALFKEDRAALQAMGPATAIRAAQAGLPEDAIVALDVGAHRITASHVWTCRQPFTLLQSNGLSSMGFGLPAAIAAKLTCPERRVMALIGDAGFAMSLGELGVAAERGMDLTVLYLADASHALIALKQRRSDLPPRGMDFRNPDVQALAAAYGGVGVRVEDPASLTAAVREAGEAGGLRLIEAVIDPSPYANQV